jgi:hypothetical protein
LAFLSLGFRPVALFGFETKSNEDKLSSPWSHRLFRACLPPFVWRFVSGLRADDLERERVGYALIGRRRVAAVALGISLMSFRSVAVVVVVGGWLVVVESAYFSMKAEYQHTFDLVRLSLGLLSGVESRGSEVACVVQVGWWCLAGRMSGLTKSSCTTSYEPLVLSTKKVRVFNTIKEESTSYELARHRPASLPRSHQGVSLRVVLCVVSQPVVDQPASQPGDRFFLVVSSYTAFFKFLHHFSYESNCRFKYSNVFRIGLVGAPSPETRTHTHTRTQKLVRCPHMNHTWFDWEIQSVDKVEDTNM